MSEYSDGYDDGRGATFDAMDKQLEAARQRIAELEGQLAALGEENASLDCNLANDSIVTSQLREQLAAVTKERDTASQDAGMVMVPEEPTDEMYWAGLEYLRNKGTAWYVVDLYKAMLAATKAAHE